MQIRENRKSCLYDKGRDNFKFDYNEERAVYKYYAGFKLTLFEHVDIEKQYNSYTEWKDYILERYNKFDVYTLNEFRRHLIQRKRNKTTGISISSIVSSALISSLITYLASMLNDIQSLANIGKSMIWKIILVFILTIVIVIIVTILFYKIIDSFYNDNVDTAFLDDYIEIIGEMIERKESDLQNKIIRALVPDPIKFL